MDFSFLDNPMPRLAPRRQVLNFYDLLGLSGSEQAADRTLAFFLDPDERHGTGTRFVDALLRTLDGAPTLDRGGLREVRFDASTSIGTGGWRVDVQVSVDQVTDPLTALNGAGIIDLYLTNDELDLAIVIENKVGAPLRNPLESYVRHAVEDHGTVLLVVLAPYRLHLDGEEALWVSGPITYADLFDQLGEPTGADTADVNLERSADLLRQFREIRERSRLVTDYTREARFIDEFRSALAGREQALSEFFEVQRDINKMCRTRSENLQTVIGERLAKEGLAIDSQWQGHYSSRWAYTWNAYHLMESNNTVELILTPDPKLSGPILAKAYSGRRIVKLYPEFDHIPIGVRWAAPDEDVAEAFVEFALQVVEAHPAVV